MNTLTAEKRDLKTKAKKLRKEGYIRVKVDNEIKDLSEDIELEKNKKHNIEVIIDRLIIKEGIRSRLYSSLETSANLAKGNRLQCHEKRNNVYQLPGISC